MNDSGIAFALGGLAGNNAHGAGFLQAALEKRVEPAMISCTSGQIYWTYQYLLAKKDKTVDLRRVLQKKINEMKPFNNPDIDTFMLWLQGVPGVYRPAFQEWYQDLAINGAKSLSRLMRSSGTASFFEAFLEIFPNRLYDPVFTNEFLKDVSDKMNGSETGIIFNAYNPVEGVEYINLNQAARTWLARSKKDPAKYEKGKRAGFRTESYYQDITPEAVLNGLWLYGYGFDRKKDKYLDGAYFRQIILSELTYSRNIYVVRPIRYKWIGELPKSYVEQEDLKTEVGFNGSYAGEKHRINLINKLLRDGELKSDKYHEIILHEIELGVQRGFFDYIYESLDVFDNARYKSLETFKEPLPAISPPARAA
jgi:hypothetical protein